MNFEARRSPQKVFEQSSERRTFLLLEAMRGTAALLVVSRHVLWFYPRFHMSYLAVDLFYTLSGFVLSYSYEKRLKARDMGKLFFFALRVIRIYPLYLIFTLVGILAAAIAHSDSIDPMSLIQSVFLLPKLQSSGSLYPFDDPSWSLFFELFISFIFGAVLIRLCDRYLYVLAAASFAILACGVFSDPHGLDVGWLRENFIFGFFRVGFSFIAGMLIFRGYSEDRPVVVSNWRAALILTGAMLVMIAPFQRYASPETLKLIDLAAIAIIFPLSTFYALKVTPKGWFARIAKGLGQLSYPIYVAHVPLYGALWAIISLCIYDEATLNRNGPILAYFYMAMLIPLSYWLDVSVDLPIRKKLIAAMKRFRHA